MADGCCPPGSWPALKSEESGFRGSTVTMSGGTAAYVVGPPEGSATEKGVVLLQDIFLYNGGRCRGVADQFAEAGYLVVMPDISHGEVCDATAGLDAILAFVQKFPAASVEKILKEEVIPLMKEKGVVKSGIGGFCWGSLNVFYTCIDDVSVEFFKAGFNFHPSLVLHGLAFQGHAEAVDLAEKIKVPQILLAAGNDPPFVREDGSVINTIKVLGGEVAEKSKAVNFDDMTHGWVNRGELSTPGVEEGVKKAITYALDFLKDVLG